MSPVTVRLRVLTLCLLAGSAYIAAASRPEVLPPRTPLTNLSMSIAGWNGQREADLSPEILQVLGADDYIVRSYYKSAATPIGLYIGYHASQRQGDTIHSPLNCLPGAGWQPTEVERRTIEVADVGGQNRAIEVNRVIITKGTDRQLVLYWYQSHRRVVASEYWGKIYTVLDSVRYHRSDAALVRVVAPLPERGDRAKIEDDAIRFVQAMFPSLSPHLPS